MVLNETPEPGTLTLKQAALTAGIATLIMAFKGSASGPPELYLICTIKLII